MDSITDVSQLHSEHMIIDYKRNIFLYESTYRHLLYLISKDSRTLNGNHYIEILQLFRSDKEKYKKLGEVIRIYLELKEKGYVKSGKFNATNIITTKGKVHRIITHPSLGIWGIIVAVVTTLITLLIAL